MRCRHCGADFAGGRCGHCGSDEFVDVADHYNSENVVTYQSDIQYFADASGRVIRARV
jgi:hypothetical protein